MDEDNEPKEPKVTASDMLFANVYQISEDMIESVYRFVEDASKFESIFKGMCEKLDSINQNLDEHIVKLDWLKSSDRKKVLSKITQAKELSKICKEYAAGCHHSADMIIGVTEGFEKNKKIKGIIKNIVKNMDAHPKDNEKESEEREDSD